MKTDRAGFSGKTPVFVFSGFSWSKMRFFGFWRKLMIIMHFLYGSYRRQNYFGFFCENRITKSSFLDFWQIFLWSKVVKNEVFLFLTKIYNFYRLFVWLISWTELFRIFLRKPHQKIFIFRILADFWTFWTGGFDEITHERTSSLITHNAHTGIVNNKSNTHAFMFFFREEVHYHNVDSLSPSLRLFSPYKLSQSVFYFFTMLFIFHHTNSHKGYVLHL